MTPYRGRVANGTAWEIQPVIRASGAAEGVAPKPAKSSVTAVGALQHTTSTFGGGFRDEFRAGQTFDFNLRTSVVGVAPERDDVLYADLTRAYPLSLTLPTNIEFVAFAEGSTDGAYDPVTRTVTWNYEERQHNQKSVSLRVADAAPTGAKLSLNSAVEAHLIGESTPVSASDKRTITVLSNDLVDTTLDMDVATNFLVSGAEHVFIAPEDETSAPVTVTALLQPQHRDTTSDLGLTMPCASATTAPCGDPATYPTKPLTVSVKRGDGATGEVDVELTLTDGTTETVKVGATPFSLDRWADTLQKVEAKSLPHPVGSSTHELSVVLVVPAGAAIDTEDWLREHASATVTADDNPSEQVKIEDERANQFLRGALHVGLGSTGVIGGWSTGEQGVEIKAYVQWAAPAGERRDAASQAILLPAGLKFNGYSSGEASYSEVPDFAGTGRTLVRFHGVPSMHGGTIMVDTDSLPPGLYDYELFNGFSGFENPNCTRLYAGEGLDQDLQKRIADVFVDGQADDACHSSFPLVVTGNKTGQAIEKSVRGDLDAQWQTAPGTVGVSDDGTGTAEYRITWANTGPTELGDVVIYDLLPGTKDSGSVGQLAGMSRESDFDVTLDDVVVPAGFQVAYSESDNPCRPELGQASGTCVDDWTSDARADLSQVRALRFTADDSMPAGQSAVFNITVTLPAFGEEQAAMNTAASGATDSTGSDVLSIETPYVGAGGVLRGPDFVASKQSSVDEGAPVRPGDEIEYTLDIRNKGTLPGEFAFDDVLAEVLDDAALTKQPVATTDGAGHVAAAVVGDLLEVRGALGSGETATVTYSVTVTEEAADRGDDLLRNALVAEGETPADTCGADDTTCTVHRVEDILVEKSAVPESGSAVTGGDTVGYKIKLRNLGKQPASPEFVDHLAGVLDDATLTGGPQVDTNEVTAELVGSQLQIAGDLEPDGSAIVSYEVAVPLDAADRGDDLLRNIVTPAGETPDEECVEGSKTCTEHPIEDVSFSKTASPAAGTAVKPGED
ncbi:MAG: DUF11 domain-containing protein, partial [Leucobacter sp.]|nr:DUF11 domain-containing protein [Leucobacter sp.]